jgi:predicted nuclease of predicted toxin-antitoxin system
MRLLADENISGSVIRELRRLGHDVVSVKETIRSAPDRVLLTRATEERRILITHDKDFGELAYRHGIPSTCGIVLFRLSGSTPEDDNTRILTVLSSDVPFMGHFCVVTDDRLRIRPLPSTE